MIARRSNPFENPFPLLERMSEMVVLLLRHEAFVEMAEEIARPMIRRRRFWRTEGQRIAAETTAMQRWQQEAIEGGMDEVVASLASFRENMAEITAKLVPSLLGQHELSADLAREALSVATYWNDELPLAPEPESEWHFPSFFLLVASRAWQHVQILDRAKTALSSAAGKAVVARPAGSFMIVNASRFRKQTVDRVVENVTRAEQLLREKDLAMLCYGQITLTRQIMPRKRTLAIYIGAYDELLIHPEASLGGNLLRTICHELGHRLISRYYQSGPMLGALYRKIKAREESTRGASHPTGLYPAVGEVHDFKLTDGTYRIRVKAVDRLSGEVTSVFVGRIPKGMARERTRPLSVWREYVLGVRPLDDRPQLFGFVTAYARESAEENFCELLSYYVTDSLPVELETEVKDILELATITPSKR